jgi:hypothetical protein
MWVSKEWLLLILLCLLYLRRHFSLIAIGVMLHFTINVANETIMNFLANIYICNRFENTQISYHSNNL